jgi:hypothetical protein
MTTNKKPAMSIKENIKTALRVFVLPKDWRAKGNMLFDELFLLCHSQKEIAEDEIQRRQAVAWNDYQSVRKAQITLIGIMSQLAAAFSISLVFHVTITVYASAILFVIMAMGLVRTQMRGEILRENMNGCYAWLFYEILHPTHYEMPAEMVSAFEEFCERSDKQSAIEEKKFNRIINGFGYSIITVNN